MGRIIGVGNAHIDFTYTVSSLPGADEGGVIHDRSRRLGGTELNVLRALATLDHEPGLVARLGDDTVGQFVTERLRALSIETDRVRTVPGESSSYCLVVQTPTGERSIFGGGESSLALSLAPTDMAYLEGGDAVVTSGFTPAAVLEDLVGRDPLVVFDLAGRLEELRPRGYTQERLSRLLPAADVVVGTEIAVESCLGTHPTPAAMRDVGITRGAITAGTDGATVFDADAAWTVPSIDVAVEDTTGAGDAFTAGLIDQLVSGRSLEQAGCFATVAAGLACTVSGPGVIPGRETILRRQRNAGVSSSPYR